MNKKKSSEKKPIIAYKVFNPDWACRDKKYAVGKTYTEKEIKMCQIGIHACLSLGDCFSYYSFDPKNKVAEVEIRGKYETHDEDSKIVTDKMYIIRELSWEEVLRLANSGHRNSGHSNSGNWNSGNRNSGHRNSGNWNSGNWNSGDRNSGNRNSGHSNSGHSNSGHSNSGHWNSGDWNSGDRNSGHNNSGNWNSGNWNSGNWNSGDRNSGDRNSGDWNSGNRNSGLFNTNEPILRIFNKNSKLTIYDWFNHPAYNICCRMDLTAFIGHDIMTEDEKKNHPEFKTIGGYLKTNNYKTACDIWWNKLTENEKKIVQTIPNFSKEIFFEITGIKL